MVMVGRRVLHRSLPVLFALLLAFFSPSVGHITPTGGHPDGVTLSGVRSAALSELPGAATPDVTVADAERGDRTGEVSSPAADGAAVTGQPTATDADGVLPADALTSQFTSGAAASRAPPATV